MALVHGGQVPLPQLRKRLFHMHPSRGRALLSVIGLSSSRVMQLLMSGVEPRPPVHGWYMIRHIPRGLVSGFATGQSVFFKFFNDCSENLTAAVAELVTHLFLLKT